MQKVAPEKSTDNLKRVCKRALRQTMTEADK